MTVFDIITGSFGRGEYLHAPWRTVQKEARERRGLGVNLLTTVGLGIEEGDVPGLEEEGVRVINKPSQDLYAPCLWARG